MRRRQVLGAAGLLVAAGATTATPAADRGEAARRLHALLAAADEEDLALVPQNALQRGDLRFAGEFGDGISDAHLQRARRTAASQWQRLQRIPRAALAGADRMAFDTFEWQLRMTLRGHAEGVERARQHMPLDPLYGPHVTFAQLSSGEGVAPYATLADYEAGLARMAGFVAWVDRCIAVMRRGLRAGPVQPRILVEHVIGQLRDIVAGGTARSPYLQPLRRWPDAIGEAERTRLAAAYEERVAQQLLPAHARLLAFLESEYLPRARGGPPGLAGLRDGPRLYAHLLELHATLSIGADEVHRIGLAEVARIRGEQAELRSRLGHRGEPRDFAAWAKARPGRHFESREAVLQHHREAVARIQALLPRWFGRLPRMALELRAMPPEQEGRNGGAYYIPGTADGSRPAVVYLDTGQPEQQATWHVNALMAHEAVPGHHLQGALAVEDEALPALLRHGWFTGHGEGWALYCEWLGREMGLYDDPWQAWGRTDLEMLRAVRLVVDTGLHAQGWSRQRALDYMAAHTSLGAAEVAQQIDRYIAWPGQATAYKLGEITIRRLRERAARRLGAAFDLRGFHDRVLDTGTVPLALLRRKIEGWAEAGRR